MESFAEAWAETLIGLDLIDKDGIATRLGLVENVQEGRAGWLLLVRHIRVPGYGGSPGLEKFLRGLVICPAVYKMNLRVSLGIARSRMAVVSTKVSSILQGLLDGQVCKILVSEGENFALCRE